MNKRPKLRTPENADRICELLAQGCTVRQVAQRLGCDHSAILHWVRDDQDAGGTLCHRYARAMELRALMMAEDLLLIGDDPCLGPGGGVDHAAVQRARLMCDNRRWLLSKLLPRQFGDKVTQELVGNPDQPIVNRIELVPIDPQPRDSGDEAPPPRLRALSSG